MAEGKTGKTLNLTEGNPLKLILLFAIPVFLGRLFQMMYSLIDTKIVGNILGEEALAAVGSVSILYNLLTGIFSGFTLGFSIVTAQNYGSGNEKLLKKNVASSIMLGMMTAVVIIFAVLLFLNPILHAMNVPEEQFCMAHDYIRILVWGMFVTLAYNLCADMLRAIGDSVTPLIFLVIAAVTNIVLDYLFIGGFSMGVSGAACATVLSQLVSAVLCFLRIRSGFPILHISKNDLEWDRERMRLLYQNGLAMALMSSLVNCGTLILQTGINKLGTNIIVAHTAARKVFEIFSLPVSVFGASMATYCGQNMGAGKIDRVKRGIWLAIVYTAIWSGLTIIASYTIGGWLVYLVTGSHNKTVILNATNYLKFDTLFYIVTTLICILRNAMQGLGDHITPLISSGLEMAGKIVIAATLVPWLGYTGVIICEPIVWFIMVIPLLIQTFRMPVLRTEKTDGKI